MSQHSLALTLCTSKSQIPPVEHVQNLSSGPVDSEWDPGRDSGFAKAPGAARSSQVWEQGVAWV